MEAMEDLSQKGQRHSSNKRDVARGKERPIFGDPSSLIIPPTGPRATADCFVNFCVKHRNADADRWLPSEQRVVQATEVLVFPVVHDTMTKEWGARLCGLHPFATDEEVAAALLEKVGTLTLPQVKETVTSRELVGVADNGCGNFFFLTGKEEGRVYGGVVLCSHGGWRFDVFPLTYGAVWAPGVRVLIPAWNVSTRIR